MTTLETMADDIEFLREIGVPGIVVPLDLAELMVNKLKAERALQGRPVPPIRARQTERPAHER